MPPLAGSGFYLIPAKILFFYHGYLIEMPKLADTMTEGVLVKWKKKVGDAVQVGDVVAEVETDKATMEMEAFDDGILSKILVAEGEKAPIGARIALLLSAGEKAPADDAPPAAAKEAKPAASAPAPNAAPSKASLMAGGQGSNASQAAGSERVKISPLARKLAGEKGVEISSLHGTGPGGRIIAWT